MIIERTDFNRACDALWIEIDYQNNLSRRTDDEATDIPGFATLARVYMAKLESDWAMNPGISVDHHQRPQVPEAQDGLRKLAAIFIRAMVYTGIRGRFQL